MSIKAEIEKLKEVIRVSQDEIYDANRKIKELQSNCKHEDVTPSGESAICNICLIRLTWYCPTSPKLVCDYNQDDGSYDEDCCRYCGEPEERK